MIDIFVLIVALWALFSGWRAGFLQEVVSAVGIFVGLFVAATCYSAFGEYLAVNGTETNMFTSIVAFLLLWIAVPIVLGLVARVMTKALKGMKLGIPNSILGSLVSLAKFAVLMSCIFSVMEALGIMDKEKTASSRLFEPTKAIVSGLFDEPADRKITPADSLTNRPDTVWIDMRPDTTAHKK